MNTKADQSSPELEPPRIPPPRWMPLQSVATNIALGYALLGALWILGSDWLLHRLVPDLAEANRISMVKGWFYVAITSVLLWGVLSRYFRILRESAQLLRESEQRWQFALDGAGHGVWDWNAQTNEVVFSPRLATMLGYAPEEFGRDLEAWEQRVHPEDSSRVRTELLAHLEGRVAAYVTEHRLRCKDGSYKWVLDQGKVMTRDAEGKPVRVIGTHTDISRRKAAEERAARLYRQNDYILNSAAEGILGLDLEDRHTFVNAAAARMLGYGPEELVGQPAHVTWHHTQSDGRPYPQEDCLIYAASRRGAVQRVSTEVFWRKDGTSFPVEYASTPIVEQGRVVGMVVTFNDITERKRAEAAEVESAVRRRILLEQSRDGIVIVDEAGRACEANASFAALLGYTVAEVLQLHVWDWDANLDQKQIEGMIQAIDVQGDHFETQHRRKDGSMVEVEISSNAAVLGGRKLIFCVCRDITQRKQVERALRESEARFRETLDVMLEGCQIIGFDWRYHYLNSAAASQGRTTVAAVLGHTMMEAFPGIETTPMFAHLRRCMAERRPVQVETEFAFADGSKGWFELRVQPVTEGVFILSLDITQRKRAELLRQALLELGEALNAAPRPLDAARAVLAAADQLWAWDAATLDLVMGDPPWVRSVIKVDTLEGRRQELVGAGSVRLTPFMERVMREGAQLVLRRPEAGAEDDLVPFGDQQRRSASIMSVPVRREAGRVGVLSLQSYQPQAYTLADLQTLQAMADYCASALARLQYQEQLQTSEARYRLLAENGSDVIWLYDLATDCFQYVSPSVERLRGFTLPEVMRQTMQDALTPESYGRVKADLPARLTAYAQGDDSVRIQTHEVEQNRKDGSIVATEVVTTLVADAKRQVTHIQGVSRDITIRRQAEIALKASEERFRTLVESAPMGIFIQADGRFAYLNVAALRMFGATAPRQLLGHNVLERFHQDYREQVWQRIQTLNHKLQEVAPAEERVVRLDGGEFEAEFSAVPFQYEAQAGALVFFQEISGRKRLEAQLRQAQKLEGIGQLAGGVAHDFNNILAATMMHLGLLQMNPALDAETIQALRDLEVEARRGAALTRQLLMFSRRSVLAMKPLDLNEIVANLLKMLTRLIGEHIELRSEGMAGLPLVAADAGMVEQVLMNLVVNARDAMPKGGRITIRTAVATFSPAEAQLVMDRRPGRFVCLAVVDTGTGMTAETIKHIFEPFFTTKEAGQGTGLGLATVYGIVAQHQGWVEVTSTVGAGASFSVYLPALAAAPPAPISATDTTTLRRGRETILLVEDDARVRLSVGQFLRVLGYQVHEAATGREAMRVWEEHQGGVDLLLTDMIMPEGMTGLELAEQLQALKPGLQVIISSGYSAEIVQAGIPNRPGIVYLPKPHQIKQLADLVRQRLDGKP